MTETGTAGGARCAMCKEPIQPSENGGRSQYHPFCSRRCADLDLGRWMTGAYSAPAEELDDPDLEELERLAERKYDER